jgi:hypothetical protein
MAAGDVALSRTNLTSGPIAPFTILTLWYRPPKIKLHGGTFLAVAPSRLIETYDLIVKVGNAPAPGGDTF